MNGFEKKKSIGLRIYALNRKLCLVFSLFALFFLCACSGDSSQAKILNGFAMDTLITQTAYGDGAEEAMQAVVHALAEEEARLSHFLPDSDIGIVNASAGEQAVTVAPQTAQLVQRALLQAEESEGAFALSIEPLTTAWDITGESPRVVPQNELEDLLPLVNDEAVHVQGDSIRLEYEGMGLDLGGLAKGEACNVAAEIYAQHEVDSALLSLGGNVYARGTKPDETAWRIGFRDPQGGQDSYIASFCLQDAVVAISGGYERFFEQDGERYIHIIDPRTGYPAESDLLSVGVIHEDGLIADIWSTTLYVQGLQGALAYMQDGGQAIALDTSGKLYVSTALQADFELQTPDSHEIQFVEESQ